MNRVRKIVYVIGVFSIGIFGEVSPFLTFVKAQGLARRAETELRFPRELHAAEVNFNLQPTGNRKFKIILDEKSKELTNVKVFDILGNLILEDKIGPADGLQKIYDFSSINSQLFVVEVGNAKYNKTKSIYANPHGERMGKSED